MDDSFSVGQQPKKRRGRVAAPPRHAGAKATGFIPLRAKPGHARRRSFERMGLLIGIIAVFVVAVLVWGFLRFMSSSGQEAAAREGEAIDHAQDVQAQLTGTSAIQAAEGVYAQAGSFELVTPESLKAYEPTFTYTEAASTEPNTVSVRSTSEGVGLAIGSSSGTCLYAFVAEAGVSYGSGTECTGDAALQASSPAWPTTN